ncbi:MAG TPA: hypothetical protein VE057_01960 [Archangium sp.]|nr:hypothetical protein [Archangium sp.]
MKIRFAREGAGKSLGAIVVGMLAVATAMGGCGHGSSRREAALETAQPAAQEAERLRALYLLTGARELKERGQPHMAAKLLLAINRPEQLRDWEAVVHAVLAQAMPEVAWDADSDGLFTTFSPDGTRGATGYPDGTLRVWRSDGKGEPVVLRGKEGSVESVTFSPDGARVLTTSINGTARIWRADGQGEPVVLQGHEAAVVSAAFSPDGSRVVTASMDGTARVWRADGQGEPVLLQAYGAVPASSAAFSPDGSRVVTAHEDGSARLWFLSVDGLRQQLRKSNHNCMPPSMRQTYLGEQEEEARKGHEACERSYGRAPRLPLPR